MLHRSAGQMDKPLFIKKQLQHVTPLKATKCCSHICVCVSFKQNRCVD